MICGSSLERSSLEFSGCYARRPLDVIIGLTHPPLWRPYRWRRPCQCYSPPQALSLPSFTDDFVFLRFGWSSFICRSHFFFFTIGKSLNLHIHQLVSNCFNLLHFPPRSELDLMFLSSFLPLLPILLHSFLSSHLHLPSFTHSFL